jgi:hypothetical protein
MQLPNDVIEALDEILTPLMDNEGYRRALLIRAFGTHSLLEQIDYTGPASVFTIVLVRHLAKYGEIEKGKPALVVLLTQARDFVGVEKQKQIEKLCQRLLQTPPTLEPKQIQVKQNEPAELPQQTPLPERSIQSERSPNIEQEPQQVRHQSPPVAPASSSMSGNNITQVMTKPCPKCGSKNTTCFAEDAGATDTILECNFYCKDCGHHENKTRYFADYGAEHHYDDDDYKCPYCGRFPWDH